MELIEKRKVTPFSLTKLRLNIVDGANYQIGGNALYYNVLVEKAGFYYITLKSKQLQNFQTSFRRITINDEVPFKEANLVRFAPQKKWKNHTLSNEKLNINFILMKE